MWVRLVISIVVLLMTCWEAGYGEDTNAAPADSVVYAYLPYVKSDSDIGIEDGLVPDRFHYQEQLRPFRNPAMLRLKSFRNSACPI